METIQEPLKSEYPSYNSRKNDLPFYEDLHYKWRQLPTELKSPNVPIPNETNVQRMNRLLDKARLIERTYCTYQKLKLMMACPN